MHTTPQFRRGFMLLPLAFAFALAGLILQNALGGIACFAVILAALWTSGVNRKEFAVIAALLTALSIAALLLR